MALAYQTLLLSLNLLIVLQRYTITAAHPSSPAQHHHHHHHHLHHAQYDNFAVIRVHGTAICDLCQENQRSNNSVLLSGATITLTCKTTRKQHSSSGSLSIQTSTSNDGVFTFNVSSLSPRTLRKCKVKLLYSPLSFCKKETRYSSKILSPIFASKPRENEILTLSIGWISYQPNNIPKKCRLTKKESTNGFETDATSKLLEKIPKGFEWPSIPSLFPSPPPPPLFPNFPPIGFPPLPNFPYIGSPPISYPPPPPPTLPNFPPIKLPPWMSFPPLPPSPFSPGTPDNAPPFQFPPNPFSPPPSLFPPFPFSPPPSLFPPNPFSPPSLFPPNPFSPPSLFPPNPFSPPSFFPPNPFAPPSLFPPNPFFPPWFPPFPFYPPKKLHVNHENSQPSLDEIPPNAPSSVTTSPTPPTLFSPPPFIPIIAPPPPPPVFPKVEFPPLPPDAFPIHSKAHNSQSIPSSIPHRNKPNEEIHKP